MALTNAFYEAVNSRNVRRVRIMMKDSLLIDPSFREFKEMESVATSLQGLYDIHDGREFELDEENWDDNYMDKQMVQMISNFSHERIEHIKDVVRRLRPVARITRANDKVETQFSSQRKESQSYEEQKRLDQLGGRYRGAKIATGTIAGAVIGGIAASAAGVTVVGGAIGGAIVGGVVVTIVSNGGH